MISKRWWRKNAKTVALLNKNRNNSLNKCTEAMYPYSLSRAVTRPSTPPNKNSIWCSNSPPSTTLAWGNRGSRGLRVRSTSRRANWVKNIKKLRLRYPRKGWKLCRIGRGGRRIWLTSTNNKFILPRARSISKNWRIRNSSKLPMNCSRKNSKRGWMYDCLNTAHA